MAKAKRSKTMEESVREFLASFKTQNKRHGVPFTVAQCREACNLPKGAETAVRSCLFAMAKYIGHGYFATSELKE